MLSDYQDRLFGLVSFTCVSVASAQVTYSFTTINVLDAAQTFVEGINNIRSTIWPSMLKSSFSINLA